MTRGICPVTPACSGNKKQNNPASQIKINFLCLLPAFCSTKCDIGTGMNGENGHVWVLRHNPRHGRSGRVERSVTGYYHCFWGWRMLVLQRVWSGLDGVVTQSFLVCTIMSEAIYTSLVLPVEATLKVNLSTACCKWAKCKWPRSSHNQWPVSNFPNRFKRGDWTRYWTITICSRVICYCNTERERLINRSVHTLSSQSQKCSCDRQRMNVHNNVNWRSFVHTVQLSYHTPFITKHDSIHEGHSLLFS